MNIYVWIEFEPDYCDGLAFAVADSEESAKELVLKRYFALGNDVEKVNWGKVQVFDVNSEIAFAVKGEGGI